LLQNRPALDNIDPENQFRLRAEAKWQLLYGFLTPILVMLIAFIAAGLAPFGNRNLMAMDAYAQYFPMLREYVRAGSDWSFAGALGFNQLTQSAYYTNSPLWLLLHLVPLKFTIEAVHFIILFRFGLAGFSFTYFIVRYYKSRSKFAFIFAAAYALSAYTLAFINQFMWMDLVVLLPLLAASLWRSWEKDQFIPYILVLATALYTNFYLAYMLCLFAPLWSIHLMFRQKEAARKRWRYLIKFAFASLIASGLVAFVLIPTFLSLRNTLAVGLSPPETLKLYHPIRNYLLRFLPFQKISLAFEEANLYCGLTAFLLAVFYLFSRQRTARERWIFSLFIIGSYFSFNLNFLDYLWHGLHFPNQLPARQSFLFIFVLLIYACKVYDTNNFTIRFQALDLHKPRKSLNLKTWIAIVLLLEILVNAAFTLTTYTWKADHGDYIQYEAEMHDLLETYAPQGNEFYRIEFLQPAHNQGLRYGYNGLGYYSSLMSKKCYQFFQNIGMEVYARNVSTNYVPDALLNDVFAVRYLIQKNDAPVEIEKLNLIKVKELEKLTLYENPGFLPLGFAISGMDFQGTNATQMKSRLRAILQADPLQSNPIHLLTLTEYRPDRIKGRISLPQDAQLLTSIGAEKGWKILVDGVNAETFQAFDYLLAASLKAGDHDIELLYTTPGKIAGSCISISCLLLLFAWAWIDRYKHRKKA
jgi:uncharacterized membrane protein YfhO